MVIFSSRKEKRASEKEIPPAEVPEGWGLLTVRGGGLIARKEAPVREAVPLTREIQASLIRTIAAGIREGLQSEAAEKERDARALVQAKRELGYQRQSDTIELEELRRLVSDFNKVSGLELSRFGDWMNTKLAEAVKIMMNTNLNEWPRHLADSATLMERNAKMLREAITQLQSDGKEPAHDGKK